MMQTEYLVNYDILPSGRENLVSVMLRIQADTQNTTDRLPLNLSVVLDRSGSMAGDKLDYVKKAAQFLIRHLGAKDYFSLVSYNHDVSVDFSPSRPKRKDTIDQAIEKLMAGGMTNLSGGWLQGCELVKQNLADRQVNRVLLLSDGLANRGITDLQQIIAIARQKRDDGITTTTMGVGLDFNEDLLTRMASEGGGAYYFIDDPDQAPHLFAEELRDLLTVVAQNLSVRFRPTDCVRSVTQLNTYPYEVDGRNVDFRLGDLYSDELKTLVLDLDLRELEAAKEVEIAHIQLVYDEIGDEASQRREIEFPVKVAVVAEAEYSDVEPKPDVMRSVLLLRAARAREVAIRYADEGQFQKAANALSNAANDIMQASQDDEELQAEHDMLREEAVDMEIGAQRYDAYSRKSSTSKIFYSTQRERRGETTVMHARLKSSRRAIERSAPTPNHMKWKQERLELTMPQLCFGRADDNDIVIPETDVSEHHCRIVRRNGDLYLEDLQSTNGTYANGGRIDKPFRLSAGDVVTVGTWLFMFTH